MEARRNFKITDAHMLKQVLGLLGNFEENHAAFETYDSSLGNSFLLDWKAAMEAAVQSSTDYVEVNKGEILLDKSISALEACHTKYQEVKYFAGKAFPKNKEAMKEFGEGQFTKVRSSPLRMVQFMETLHGVASKYNAALIAQSYTQAAIDEIATLTDTLRADNNLQQLKKKERPTESRKRIETVNAFFAFGQQVAKVAPMVFRQRPAKRHMFRLSDGKAGKRLSSWQTLAPLSTHKKVLSKGLKKFNVFLTNQGEVSLEYWQADNLKQTRVQKYSVAPGEVVAITIETPARKFLITHNPSSKEVRLMWRKELKEEMK